MQDRLNVFLKELADLTKKHGFTIGGCGDCGSPWIIDENDEEVLQHLGYVMEDGAYIAYNDRDCEYDENGNWLECVKEEARAKYGLVEKQVLRRDDNV